MTDLIERLESATEGSRELDAEIERRHGSLSAGDVNLGRSPHYTTSIDAALTLVPEGWWVKTIGEIRTDIIDAGDKHKAIAWVAALQHVNGGQLTNAFADTPALALCAAASKACHGRRGEVEDACFW